LVHEAATQYETTDSTACLLLLGFECYGARYFRPVSDTDGPAPPAARCPARMPVPQSSAESFRE
jgi:hypothetical protein